MPDEREEKSSLLPGSDEAGTVAPDDAAPVDPWAEAFAKAAGPATPAPAGDQGEGAPAEPGAAGNSELPGTTGDEPADVPVDAGADGGPVPDAGEGGGDDDHIDAAALEASIVAYSKQIEDQAVSDTAKLFAEQVDDQGRPAIRQTNGKLGATINDPDIYRVDPDTGVATFYNPDTGRPFTGDNPRAQAKQWVEDYNEDLRDTFNRYAEQRKTQLSEAAAPVIELMKFAPTYENLDPVRQQMLDALIEDYEVNDADGNPIGYSIDLNKALAQVNKQVAAIQQTAQKKPPTGPAIDMPVSGSGNVGNEKPITSLAEAMEAQQNAQLEKLRNR